MVADPFAGRVTVVLGAAGYGKTTAVRAWLGDRQANWFRGQDLSGLGFATGERITVIDDMHLANAAPPRPAPQRSRLVLIARRPLSAAVLRWAASPPAELGPAALVLSQAQIERVLLRRYRIENQAIAASLHRVTCGWPALAQLLTDALDPALISTTSSISEDDLLAALVSPGTRVADYVSAEVLGDLPDPARRLLTDAAHLGSISADLAVGLGHRRPEAVIGALARLGILHPPSPGHRWYKPVAVVAAVARAASGRPSPRRRQRVLATAADWHLRHDRPADALALRVAAADHAASAALLIERGPVMLAGGSAADVVSAIRQLPPQHCDEQTDLLLAEALQLTGESAAAIAVYERLADGRCALPAALAWRFGVAVYLWGNPRDAVGVFDRGILTDETTADEALLLAWMAAAHRLAGDMDKCQDHAVRAHRAATASGSARAAVSAHVALALAADLAGDPAALQAHYAQALALAEPAGDVVQAIRIRANLAVALEREARYGDALEMVRPAVALAQRAGHGSLLAMARNNEATLLHRLGRLDEAAQMYQQSIEAYQRINSLKVAYPLGGLGDLHRERGRLSEARAAYEESLRASTAHGNRQATVPALCGLARTVAAEDPALAAQLARQATEHASGPVTTTALLACGHAALGRGEAAEARRLALAAADSASQHRDRAGLAESLELRASATVDQRERRQCLSEALVIWRGASAGLDADRVRVALGRLPAARSEEALDARLAAGRLAAAGVLLPAALVDSAHVVIRTFGSLGVLVDGEPAPVWQSRKAYDLLRILIAGRGRPVARDELIDLLWGREAASAGDAKKINHRLAVALSTVRGVLDPGRRSPPDHFVSAGPTNIWLNLDRMSVDVESFLTDARHGLRLCAQGAADDARIVLAAVEQAYSAEVFADEPYDTWAQPLRDEVRATYLNVLRTLARLARHAGEVDEATVHLRRIIADEPYDEQAHRDLLDTLVDAGRHGEARRAYDRYVEAMTDIGVPPPDRAILLNRL
ncbi:hypothetical protein Rhe02_18210 [Rhizocola hellebori]|uniref:Bacterial transcriptional activator domain-containing protein n=1 Tax=Rhizocola hellebori TaxID=1392758 RepID=A0A8J3Q5G4_9ACTN|nr:tetratricopeptide repeat protein [Rhizocola hellebori]GIH03754.1 hypothetical protein Rhe02_18210 [Rhizocola hellebori]